MKSVQLYNVSPSMPEKIRFLEDLSRNLWWCWNTEAIELFRRIDPQLWKEHAHNPLEFFGRIPQKRLDALVDDDGFMNHYHEVKKRFERTVLAPASDTDAPQPTIAYFSLEYGIHESIRIYSGGLGCLAGDHLKEASDMGLPLVAVGLMYRCGYFQQYLNEDGWQQEACPSNELHTLPLKKACDANGQQVKVSLPTPDGVLHADVWRLDVGRIPLFLLDANVQENPPALQQVGFQLYEGDRKLRLQQELLLGIGGVQALRGLGYDPAAYHLNEGHAAFLAPARMSLLMKNKGFTLDEAREIVRRTNIFTTHTPVPAGNESFDTDLVKGHLKALEKDLGITADQILEWSRAPSDTNSREIVMTILGLRMALHTNGVSQLHGEVSRKMWQHLWPDRPEDEVPIRAITNGVHITSWLSSEHVHLYNRYLGADWKTSPADKDVLDAIDRIPEEELWRTREVCRSRLIRATRERGEQQFAARHASRRTISDIKSIFNHDTLTIGFARRFASYKRATLLLRDQERLSAILSNRDCPVQFVFAGKAHPADDGGKDLIRQIVHFSGNPNIRQHMIFLENYDIRLARYMVQGVDVWLNNPRRPLEASGTSGMKAAINGGLNLSTMDGWWVEGYSPDCGWAIGHGEEYDNHDYQDSIEAQALYNLLENEIIPTFYNRQGGYPSRWVAMMKATIRMAFEGFSSRRMLSQYQELLYTPATAEYRALLANDAERTRLLVSQRTRLQKLWSSVVIKTPTTDHNLEALHVGDTFHVTTDVNLGALTPDDVDVEIYYGPVGANNQILESHAQLMQLTESREGGNHIYGQDIVCRHSGRFGMIARVTPRGLDWKGVIPGFITWSD